MKKIELSPKQAARFWDRVDKSGSCWVWTGAVYGGYGRFANIGAHRVSFALSGKKVPAGHVIDHMCRNRACVNPDHLRAVTQRINSLENNDGPTAINFQKTHCDNGHEFTPENTRIRGRWGSRQRQCLTCDRAHKRAYKAKPGFKERRNARDRQTYALARSAP